LRASVWNAGSLLPLSNARPRPKRQQAARKTLATAPLAATSPLPPSLGVRACSRDSCIAGIVRLQGAVAISRSKLIRLECPPTNPLLVEIRICPVFGHDHPSKEQAGMDTHRGGGMSTVRAPGASLVGPAPRPCFCPISGHYCPILSILRSQRPRDAGSWA
jgi:hypothetical protein